MGGVPEEEQRTSVGIHRQKRCYARALARTKKVTSGICTVREFRDDEWEIRCTPSEFGAVGLDVLHVVSEACASTVPPMAAGQRIITRSQKIKSQTTKNEQNTPVATQTILAVLRRSLAFFNSLFPLPRFSSVI